ncbi:MAG: redoxin domain-containing protein [Dehalococcoidia bacterium]
MGSSTAPDFTIVDANGQTVRLSDFAGGKHVVLIFNRMFM